jgi:hypothetical protein
MCSARQEMVSRVGVKADPPKTGLLIVFDLRQTGMMADRMYVVRDDAHGLDGSAMMSNEALSKEQGDGRGLGVLRYKTGCMLQSPPALAPDAGSDN